MPLFESKVSVRSMQKALSCAIAALALSTQSIAMANPVHELSVSYEQDGTLSQQLNIPIYEWSAPEMPQRAIVIAIHGVAMHGKSFDCLGKNLAQQGYLVVATDMRGYGRSFDDSAEHKCRVPDCRHKVNYQKSFEDVTKLARALRERYPTLPIFGLGESLGGHMVIRLAAEHPELVDGLVLSAPAVRRHTMFDPYMVLNAGLVMANPRAKLDLMPFVKHYASDDPRVIAEMSQDPMLRRRMNAKELLQATAAIRKTMHFVPKVPSDVPVLVIQGGNDRVLHADAVITLLSKLNSKDQTVKWFAERGHILLETEFVKPDTMEAVVSWLNTHAQSPAIQSKHNREQDWVALEKADFQVRLPEEN